MKNISIVSGVLAVAGVLFLVGMWWFGTPCRTGCNVVLIMVDTLSAKHIQTYGYDRDTMPKITSFFEKGVIFENASANSTWTLPSFTGMYFSDIGSRITYADLEDRVRPHLQNELRTHGVKIRTVRAVDNDFFIMDAILRLFNPEEILRGSGEYNPFTLGTTALNELSATKEPFFLQVHTFQAHDPYRPSEKYQSLFEESDEYTEVSLNALLEAGKRNPLDMEEADIFRLRYDQQLRETDDTVARFLEGIPESVLQNTVVILSADHGEAFGEHERLLHGTNGLYEEEVHVPLMMRVPGVTQKRIAEPVSLMDMAPTILSFMRIPIPEEFNGDDISVLLQGRSLGERTIPLVTGFPYYVTPETRTNPPKFLKDAGVVGVNRELITPKVVGVRKGSEKVIKELLPAEKIFWFDLASDPEEKNNLAVEGTTPPAELIEVLNSIEKVTLR